MEIVFKKVIVYWNTDIVKYKTCRLSFLIVT